MVNIKKKKKTEPTRIKYNKQGNLEHDPPESTLAGSHTLV